MYEFKRGVIQGNTMENTIGLSLLGILSIWLSVVILGRIHMSKEASRCLLKRNQLRKINTHQNQNLASAEQND